ncbi:unnamed protein product [Moneuplotes crassus]|uniref:Uncharacterized protein n=1 Tax=Euplotes crassus TaxID=5936 RepID=A0AAD2D553_EUPCR|nr:unnamed protein product [Moneuplotes crassus]
MKLILLALIVLLSSVHAGRYLNDTDISIKNFNEHLLQIFKNHSDSKKEVFLWPELREALFMCIKDSLHKYVKEKDGLKVFGYDKDIEIVSHKVAKLWCLKFDESVFTKEEVDDFVKKTEPEITEFADNFITTTIDNLIDQSIKEDLLESWQNTEVGISIMKERPFESFLTYKTWAWLQAMNGNDTLWKEPLDDFNHI